jgi:seryl-tRNA synthetase
MSVLHNTQAYSIQRKTTDTKNHKILTSGSDNSDEINNLKNKIKKMEKDINDLKSIIMNINADIHVDDDYVYIMKRNQAREYNVIKIQWGRVL